MPYFVKEVHNYLEELLAENFDCVKIPLNSDDFFSPDSYRFILGNTDDTNTVEYNYREFLDFIKTNKTFGVALNYSNEEIFIATLTDWGSKVILSLECINYEHTPIYNVEECDICREISLDKHYSLTGNNDSAVSYFNVNYIIYDFVHVVKFLTYKDIKFKYTDKGIEIVILAKEINFCCKIHFIAKDKTFLYSLIAKSALGV